MYCCKGCKVRFPGHPFRAGPRHIKQRDKLKLMLNINGYRAVQTGVAWSDRSGRVRLEVAGPDRAKFLHNLTTNDVKRLPVNRGCEAFVTSPQGKALAYVKILACTSRFWCAPIPVDWCWPCRTSRSTASSTTSSWRTAPKRHSSFTWPARGAEELLRISGGRLPEPGELSQLATAMADCPLLMIRESPTGRPGLTMIGARSSGAKVAGLLRAHGHELGWAELDLESFEVLRIEAGTPVFGRDVTEKNLPQEIGRDAQAINFVKGCYLGQETVARLDALGHVNQILKGLLLAPHASPPPAGQRPGSRWQARGFRDLVGDLTGLGCPGGSGHGPQHACSRGCHLVVKQHERLHDRGPAATVCDLPMLPPTVGRRRDSPPAARM